MPPVVKVCVDAKFARVSYNYEIVKKFLRKNWPLVFAIAYALLPFDFIPDWLLPVGFVDDLGLLIATLLWRYIDGKRRQSQKLDDSDIIDGEIVE